MSKSSDVPLYIQVQGPILSLLAREVPCISRPGYYHCFGWTTTEIVREVRQAGIACSRATLVRALRDLERARTIVSVLNQIDLGLVWQAANNRREFDDVRAGWEREREANEERRAGRKRDIAALPGARKRLKSFGIESDFAEGDWEGMRLAISVEMAQALSDMLSELRRRPSR